MAEPSRVAAEGAARWNTLITACVVILACSHTHEILASDDNCTLKAHLPCKVIHDTEECLTWDGFYGTSLWPGPPVDLQISLFRRSYSGDDNITYPGINISWKLPHDSSFLNVKGFQVKLIHLSGYHVNKVICRMINLTGAQWRQEDIFENLRYNISLYPIHGNTTFYVQVYSLPKKPPQFTENRHISAVIKTPRYLEDQSKIEPADWLMYMVVRNDSDTCQVDVQFSKADTAMYNFRDYEIILVEDNSFNTLVEKKTIGHDEEPHVTFTSVTPGRYVIWGSPRNYKKSDIYECACYDRLINGIIRHCTETCATTKSAVFTITGAPCTAPSVGAAHTTASLSVKPSDAAVTISADKAHSFTDAMGSKIFPSTQNMHLVKLDGGKQAGIACGVIVSILLVLIVVGVFIYKKRHKTEDSISKEGENNKKGGNLPPGKNNSYNQTGNTTTVDTSKKLFVLYSNDHPLHCTVVEKLGRFLANRCGCQVVLDQWCTQKIHELGKAFWIEHQIMQADKVLIISSQGAYRKYSDRNKYPLMDESTPLGDMFTYAMMLINNRRTEEPIKNSKYIDAYFAYTAAHYRFGHNGRYKLMDHIEDLVFYLHDIQARNASTDNHMPDINARDYAKCEEGRELQKAVNDMTDMVNNKPTWFDDLYEPPINSDSGVDSIGAVSSWPSEPNQMDASSTSDIMSCRRLLQLPSSPDDMCMFFPPIDPEKLQSNVSIEVEDTASDWMCWSAPVSPATDAGILVEGAMDFIPPVIAEDADTPCDEKFRTNNERMQRLNETDDDGWDEGRLYSGGGFRDENIANLYYNEGFQV